MAWYLRLGAHPATWMLSDDENPEEVGQRLAEALAQGRAAPVQWIPTDRLEVHTLWVNPALALFWYLTETHPTEQH